MKPPPSKRIFLAVKPCEGLYAAQRELSLRNSGLPGCRWVRNSNLHLTVFFIGDVEDVVVGEITNKLPLIASRITAPVSLRFQSFSPEGGRNSKPSMIWARFEKNDEYTALNRLMLDELKPLLPEGARFHEPIPHVTLARIRSGPVPDLHLPFDCTITITGFELWMTERDDQGVWYRSLDSFKAGGNKD